jgi:hypothetical protein
MRLLLTRQPSEAKYSKGAVVRTPLPFYSKGFSQEQLHSICMGPSYASLQFGSN